MGENISQAAHFAATGAVPVGILALSLLSTPSLKDGRHWVVPEHWHQPLIQEAVVIKRSARAEEMKGFFAYVKSAEGRKTLAKFGFQTPPPPIEGIGGEVTWRPEPAEAWGCRPAWPAADR
jgi:molybdenum ABC transporter molybdate-binding protein